MNYELALKLKTEGFEPKHGWTHIPDKPELYTPDILSQLIEACGEDFWKIILEDGEWLAYGGRSTRYIRGSTPEEAVARLWLELNNKNI